MPRFVHIDHSLCRVGGHEYDYAVNILRSAEASGYSVSLAANRRFQDALVLPDEWAVYPFFPDTAHTKNCVSMGGHRHLPVGFDGKRLSLSSGLPIPHPLRTLISQPAAALNDLRRYLSRRRRIRGFAAACRRVFRGIELDAGDHVFLATLTEFDLLGLTRFLVDHPRSRPADWHLQFHFDLHEGCREDEQACRQRIEIVRRQCLVAFDRLADHRVHLYTTTEELADQYNQLGVGKFQCLPYPINPGLELRDLPPRRPLQITCAGGMRREKGVRQLRTIITSLRSDDFFHGKIEVAAQITRQRLQRLGISDTQGDDEGTNVRVLCLPYPLQVDAYHELIHGSSIALFLYDKHRYHVRCSGILLEMLAAGRPVIVPSGCWLAEQIAEPIAQHIEKLRATLPCVGLLTADQIRWTASGSGGPLPLPKLPELSLTGSDPLRTVLDVPELASEFVFAMRRAQPVEPGSYVRVETEQFSHEGDMIKRFDSIAGCRRENRSQPVLVHLDPRAARIAVQLRIAYGHDRLEVADVEAEFLNSRQAGGCPAGSVGLIAADSEQIPELLREVVQRYDHYRETAEQFSRKCLENHHPSRTIEMLTSNVSPAGEDSPLYDELVRCA